MRTFSMFLILLRFPKEDFKHRLLLLQMLNVFINGKMVSWGASGEAESADDYNIVSYRRIALDNLDSSTEPGY